MNVDIVRPGDDLTKYKLVLAPHLHVLADDLAKQLVEYVRGGGVLLTDCRVAVKDESNLAHARTLPGLLSPALGIEIEEYESLRQGLSDRDEVTYTVEADKSLGGDYTAKHYADWIKPTTAMPRAKFREPHLGEFAAVTRNEFGKGFGWYVGTIIDDAKFYDRLVTQLLADAKIKSLVAPPPGVEISLRSNAERSLLFVVNHNAHATDVEVPFQGIERISGNSIRDRLSLQAFGVAVIELEGVAD